MEKGEIENYDHDEYAKKHYGCIQLQIFWNEQLLEIDRGQECVEQILKMVRSTDGGLNS